MTSEASFHSFLLDKERHQLSVFTACMDSKMYVKQHTTLQAAGSDAHFRFADRTKR